MTRGVDEPFFPPQDTWDVSCIRSIVGGTFSNVRIERAPGNSQGPLGYFGDLVHITFGEHHAIYRIGEDTADGSRVHVSWAD